MSLLYSRVSVKPARNTARPSRPFGEGILPADPVPTARDARRMPYTAADLAWWVANSPTRNDGYEVVAPGPAPICGGSPAVSDRDWDAMYARSVAQDRLERGLAGYMLPTEAADYLSRTSLVGHPD